LPSVHRLEGALPPPFPSPDREIPKIPPGNAKDGVTFVPINPWPGIIARTFAIGEKWFRYRASGVVLLNGATEALGFSVFFHIM
jgi:hypothetical protein